MTGLMITILVVQVFSLLVQMSHAGATQQLLSLFLQLAGRRP